MVELLTVIAIISILAAIIFPVYSKAKQNAFRSSDLSAMNEIRTSLQLYKSDQGDFPPALLGYATTYSGDPNASDIIPADQIYGALYPRRVPNVLTFRPSMDKQPFGSVTGLSSTAAAAWPNPDDAAVGSDPVIDTNGDGVINSADDVACARQAYGPDTQVMRPDPRDPTAPWIPARYYRVSGYDVAPDRDRSTGNPVLAIRYTRFWTGFGLGIGGPCGSGGSLNDDPRQLGYDDPPDTTVITWNSWYRDTFEVDGSPVREKKDIVLFLGGGAKYYDSRSVFDRSWRIRP